MKITTEHTTPTHRPKLKAQDLEVGKLYYIYYADEDTPIESEYMTVTPDYGNKCYYICTVLTMGYLSVIPTHIADQFRYSEVTDRTIILHP